MEAVMKNKSKVVARMTVEREVGVKTIIEVHEDATFSLFFHHYSQEGRRRSTKREIRVSNRNEGLFPIYRAHTMTPGLEAVGTIFKGMKNVVSVKIRIIKKRAYRRLISVSPSELGGLARVASYAPQRETRAPGIAVHIPQATPKKKYSVLNGWR
jgi:hypothetical protein